MHVGVGIVVNFPAVQTGVTAIVGTPPVLTGFPAVQRFGQRAGERFQLFELIPGKQVGMAEPPAGERTLEQFDALAFVSQNV